MAKWLILPASKVVPSGSPLGHARQEVGDKAARSLGTGKRHLGQTGSRAPRACQPPGGRYDDCILTEASTSAGVKRATVRTFAPPAAVTASTALAVVTASG